MTTAAIKHKHWTLYSTLAKVINAPNLRLQEIEFRYFEQEHTFISADSVHAQVEKSIRKFKTLWIFQDLSDAIKASGCPSVMRMGHTDFLDWKKEVQTRPLLRHIRAVKLAWKCITSALKPSCDPQATNLPPKRQKYRGVEEGKSKDIIKNLCNLMPADSCLVEKPIRQFKYQWNVQDLSKRQF